MSTRPRIPLLFGTLLLIAALIFAALPGHTATAQSTILTFTPTADAFANQNYPSSNYGKSTSLRTDSSPITRSYLRFIVKGLNGAAIQSAKIRVYANNSNSTGYSVLAEANNTWSETGITYKNAPAPGSLLGTSPSVYSGQWVEVDLTQYVKAEGTYSMVLTTSSKSAISLASRESGTHAPQLVVTLKITAPTSTKSATSTQSAPTATKAPTLSTATQVAPLPTATKPPAPTATIAPTQPAPAPTATTPPTGAIYYVSTSGSDSNPGTATQPFRTIAKGLSVLLAGDTLYVRSGTYLLNHTLNINQSGTAAKPITISTAPGEPSLAVISGDLNGNKLVDPPSTGVDAPISPDFWFVYIGGSYIHFQNFEVAFSARQGIRSNGSYNVISGNTVHHTWSAGIYAHGPNNIVENNTVWRANESNNCAPATNPYGSGLGTSRQCTGDWSAGINFGDTSGSWNPSPNTIVRHNVVFHDGGEGILCMNTNGGIVEDNILFDNWALGIDEDQCGNTTFQRNLIIYTTDKTWWRGSTNPGHGIMLSNEGLLAGAPTEHDNKVINNIIIGTNFRYWGKVSGSALTNDLIANNTIVESQGMAPLLIDAPLSPGVHTNTRIADNLILQSAGSLSSVGTLVGLTFDHNLWSRNSGIVSGTGDVIANPLLANPTTPPCSVQYTYPDAAHPQYMNQKLTCVSPTGMQLTSGSPAIDKGADLTANGITVDYFGMKRPQGAAFDLGAHE